MTIHDRAQQPSNALVLEPVACPLCSSTEALPVATGEDFEYRTSDDSFLAVRCPDCSVVYLDPRPHSSELERIYPDHYHAFEFDQEHFGLAHRVRQRLEARRLMAVARSLAPTARILDVGCGDGFHLDLLRQFGSPSWELSGVDLDPRAVERAVARGLDVRLGRLEDMDFEPDRFDLALSIQTVEHVADPVAFLRSMARLLRPGGQLYLVTDNTGSLDFRLFRRRHWGGYHFPRHWNLFDRDSMERLAAAAGLDVEELGTMTTPVNWTYSVRNLLDDWGAPRWLVDRFALDAPVALGVFTVFDRLHTAAGRGGLLRVVLRRPE